MARSFSLLIVFACASLLLAQSHSIACRPKLNRVTDYAQNRIPSSVVFSGSVISVVKVKEENGTAVYDIGFKPSRWVKGDSLSAITVRGVTGSYLGTDCEGQLDFLAKVGEQWFMFGQVIGGKVNPDVFLSTRLINGQIPFELQVELMRSGIKP